MKKICLTDYSAIIFPLLSFMEKNHFIEFFNSYLSDQNQLSDLFFFDFKSKNPLATQTFNYLKTLSFCFFKKDSLPISQLSDLPEKINVENFITQEFLDLDLEVKIKKVFGFFFRKPPFGLLYNNTFISMHNIVLFNGATESDFYKQLLCSVDSELVCQTLVLSELFKI